jgi:hypothetical protein
VHNHKNATEQKPRPNTKHSTVGSKNFITYNLVAAVTSLLRTEN